MCARKYRSVADELMLNAARYASRRYQMPLRLSDCFGSHIAILGAVEMVVGALASTQSGQKCSS